MIRRARTANVSFLYGKERCGGLESGVVGVSLLHLVSRLYLWSGGHSYFILLTSFLTGNNRQILN